jgi:hypothetical protein
MGMNSFAPYSDNPLCFIVINVAPSKKVIRIFQNPILYGQSRDLLKIKGISESEIRASLLKGEIKTKILAKEIVIVCSDIDLLQFNQTHKKFLQDAGVTVGLDIVMPAGTQFSFVDEVDLIGQKNSVNRTFTTPSKFLNGIYNGNNFHIHIKHNGKDVYEGFDYTLMESGGVGTGYDTITFISFAPTTSSVLKANYVIAA